MTVQITQICTVTGLSKRDNMAIQNGGSARDYLPDFAWLEAPLWGNARAAVRMFIHRAPSV